MLSGSGTNLKILEYLASGVPVVTTPVGAEGLPLADGETALVSAPDDAAAETVRALREADLRERLSENGRDLAVSEFSWGTTLASYDAAIGGETDA
jgi:glycosyltransferase involved in cell wall biosynthesis